MISILRSTRGQARPLKQGGALGVAVGLVVAACSSGGGALEPGSGQPSSPDAGDSMAEVASTVVLEQIDYSHLDFFGNLDVELELDGVQFVQDLQYDLAGLVEFAGFADGFDPEVDATLAGRTAGGDAPGLYGGSGDALVCDVGQLLDHLTDSAQGDQAQAWADVLGIDRDGIEEYVRGLTPVRLRLDTRVTNHGFEGGEATPYQAVLQAGTAVLVDDRGMPRVKCNCGNPLTEPETADAPASEVMVDVADLAENPEDVWDDFDAADVVAVEPAPQPLEELEIIDFDDGSLGTVPTGNSPISGTGDFSAVLDWSRGYANVWFSVTDPNGVVIGEGTFNPGERDIRGDPAPVGTLGRLDTGGWDGDTEFCRDKGPEGPPSISWPTGQAPSGTYTVTVGRRHYLDDPNHEDCTIAFTLTISASGRADEVHTGDVQGDGLFTVAEEHVFEVTID